MYRKLALIISRLEEESSDKEGSKSKGGNVYNFALFHQQSTGCL